MSKCMTKASKLVRFDAWTLPLATEVVKSLRLEDFITVEEVYKSLQQWATPRQRHQFVKLVFDLVNSDQIR